MYGKIHYVEINSCKNEEVEKKSQNRHFSTENLHEIKFQLTFGDVSQ